MRAERCERLHGPPPRLEKSARLPFEEQLAQRRNSLLAKGNRFLDSPVAVMSDRSVSIASERRVPFVDKFLSSSADVGIF